MLVFILGMADVLRKIKQAEQDAEKQLADAQAEVSKIAAEARRKSVQLIADATDWKILSVQPLGQDFHLIAEPVVSS